MICCLWRRSLDYIFPSKRWGSHRLRQNYNEFISWFHQFVSQIFSTNFSQFEQLKKKTIFYWSKTVFFSQFASWKRNHNKYSLKNGKFRIRGWWNFWWIRTWMNLDFPSYQLLSYFALDRLMDGLEGFEPNGDINY